MNDQFQIAITQPDSSGKLIPVTGLLKENLKFLDFTSGSPGAEISYSTFYDRGNGCYIFGDFSISQMTCVVLALNDTPILSLGSFYVGAPDTTFLKKSNGLLTGILDAAGNRITGLPTNQNENTNPSDAASMSTLLGDNSYIGQNYYKKAGDSLTGPLNAGGNRILNLPAPASGTEPVRKQDIFQLFSSSFLPSSPNIKVVNQLFDNNYPPYAYTTIQKAINDSDSGTLILIYPGEYVENINLKPSITLQGLSPFVYIKGYFDNSSLTRLWNLHITVPANLSLSSAAVINCVFSTFAEEEIQSSVTITNNVLKDVIFLIKDRLGDSITSNGGNIFLSGCSSNKDFPPHASDINSTISILPNNLNPSL